MKRGSNHLGKFFLFLTLILVVAGSFVMFVADRSNYSTGAATYQLSSITGMAAGDVTNTYTLNPTDDSYVAAKQPTRNYGTAGNLKIDGSPIQIVYMKYDLGPYAGKQITRAKLRMYAADSSNSMQNVKSSMDNSWTENSINYNNRPQLDAIIAQINNAKSGTWIELDITNYIPSKAGQLTTIGIDSSGRDGLNVYSSESSVGKPELVIDILEPGTAPPAPSPECGDGVDNSDLDTLVDMNDPGCSSSSDTSEVSQCEDSTDNDADGPIDLNDKSCANNGDNDETVPQQCSDTFDNDGDGAVDMNDAGCTSSTDNDETNAPPAAQCADGIDNDGDGLIDMNDPGCSSSSDNDETNTPSNCGNGVCGFGESCSSCSTDCGQCPSPPQYDEKGCLDNYIEINPGFGCFVYHDNGDNSNRPVRVWYYRPAGYPGVNPKVFFAMHGSERNAEVAREYWLSYADRYNTLIVAPEFSKTYYPDADDYNRGFVKDGGGTGNLRNRNDWGLLTIEEVFDIVLAQIPGAPSQFSIGGNSGGGQFISRFAWLVPEARYEVASGTNNGWFTLPIGTLSNPGTSSPEKDKCPPPCFYPNGVKDLLDNNLLTEANINSKYSDKYIMGVGEYDTDPNSYDLTHNTFTDWQGNNRYERHHFAYDYYKDDAQARNVPYNWNLKVVYGAHHEVAEMAHSTAIAVFENVYTQATHSLSPLADAYVESANPNSNFGSSSNVYMDGGTSSAQIPYLKFDLTGIQPGDFDVAAIKVWIHDDSQDTFTVRAVSSNNWDESTITWNNAPPRMQEIGSTKGGYDNGYVYIVITDYAKQNANHQISFSIDGGSVTTGDMGFYSKEASNYPPKLELFRRG